MYSSFTSSHIDKIDTNLGRSEYSVEELSSDLCMSRGNLHLKTKSLTGRSPIELLKGARLDKARALLREGKMPLAEVTEESGYSSVSYFCTSFRKAEGLTPGEYSASFSRKRKF